MDHIYKIIGRWQAIITVTEGENFLFGDAAFIAVDWGTTNRRAWRIGADGKVEDALEDAAGITAVPVGGFGEEAARLRQRLGDLPMLLGGMIGSNRGWHEAPYVPCPADRRDIAAAILWIDKRTGIVPGICQNSASNPDVMRGEEVQIIGALASGSVPTDTLICLPGTHAKWATVREGRIMSFATWMTGEVFALLSRHSILASELKGQARDGPDFAAGVAASGSADPMAGLFRLRAAALLRAGIADGASYLSGLLIGGEVRSGLKMMDGPEMAFIGRPDLCALYAAAIAQVQGDATIVDGAEAFCAGIRALAEELV